MADRTRRSVGCLVALGAAEAATGGQSLSDLRGPTGQQQWPGHHTRLALATVLGLTRAHLRLLERGIGSPGAVVGMTYQAVLARRDGTAGTWLAGPFEPLSTDDRDRELASRMFERSDQADVDRGPSVLPRAAVVGLIAEVGSAGRVAWEVCRLSHERPATVLSAGLVGSLVALLLDGDSPLDDAMHQAVRKFRPAGARELMRRMGLAEELIDEPGSDAEQSTGRGLDSFGVLALALRTVTESADVESTILWATRRHPSVSEVAILAAMLSALVHGPDALPAAWWESDLAAVSEQLVTDAQAVADGFTPDEMSWSMGISADVLRRVQAP